MAVVTIEAERSFRYSEPYGVRDIWSSYGDTFLETMYRGGSGSVVIDIKGSGFRYSGPSVPIDGIISSIDFVYRDLRVAISDLNMPGREFAFLVYDGTISDFLPALYAGDDQFRGSAFDDYIRSHKGNDTVLGGAGSDVIIDPTGFNYLRGEDGNDSIQGGDGFDDAHGNSGDDTVKGGAGDDWTVGGKDNDWLDGEAGSDLVYGNLGADTCYGGAGNDIVRGGQQDDVLFGGDGDDFLSGDRDNDTITGGAGADVFATHGEAGIDRVLDFSLAQGDRVQLSPGTQHTVAQVGADTVISMTGGGQMILVGVEAATLTPGWIFGA